jgi:hypothetical protein
MFSLDFRKLLFVTIAVAAISCLANPRGLAAASPDKGVKITFTATGTFAATPVSGADRAMLAGQPFTVSIVASSSLAPKKQGPHWATFDPLKMTGTVYSGLVPNIPKSISSNRAVIKQTVGASEDILQSHFPVNLFGIADAIAYITLPAGTLSNDLIGPFPSVTLDPTNATVTYKNATAATVLAVQSGTLVATLPAK